MMCKWLRQSYRNGSHCVNSTLEVDAVTTKVKLLSENGYTSHFPLSRNKKDTIYLRIDRIIVFRSSYDMTKAFMEDS